MKKCILVWQVPVIEGEPYNPVEYAVHVRKAKKFAEALNRYFAEKKYGLQLRAGQISLQPR